MATNKINYKLVSLIVTLLVLGAGIVTTWAVTKERQKVMKESIGTLKIDGCKPADQNEKDILVLQTDVSYIRKAVDEIKSAVKKD